MINNISFGYSSLLKTMYKNGEIELNIDAYGAPLNKKNVSLEHIRPHSKNGPSSLSNFLLVSREENQKRGNLNFDVFLKENPEKIGFIQQYLNKLRNVFIDNKNYVEQVKLTLNRESKGVAVFKRSVDKK